MTIYCSIILKQANEIKGKEHISLIILKSFSKKIHCYLLENYSICKTIRITKQIGATPSGNFLEVTLRQGRRNFRKKFMKTLCKVTTLRPCRRKVMSKKFPDDINAKRYSCGQSYSESGLGFHKSG